MAGDVDCSEHSLQMLVFVRRQFKIRLACCIGDGKLTCWSHTYLCTLSGKVKSLKLPSLIIIFCFMHSFSYLYVYVCANIQS